MVLATDLFHMMDPSGAPQNVNFDEPVATFDARYVLAGAGAPVGAEYVVISLDATLTDERVLTGTANQISIADGGAGGNVTLSTPQDIHAAATPTFGGLTINGVTVLNEGGIDADTRIEGSGDANLLFVDAGNDRVAVGSNAPVLAKLEVFAATATQPALILRSTDLDETQRIFEILGAGGFPKYFGISPKGRVGIGTGTFATAQLAFGGTWGYDSTINVASILRPPGTTGQTLRMTTVFQPQRAMTSIWGLNNNTFIGGSSSHNVGSVFSTFSKYTLSNSYGGTVNFAYGLYVATPAITSSGSPAVTNSYGLRIDNQTIGSNIWAISTGTGLNALGDRLTIDQASPTAASPVLQLDQADVSEEFIRLIGTAAAGVLTQSIVDEGDQGGQTLEGWIKIYVQDDGNQITDQAYFIPIYTLSV